MLLPSQSYNLGGGYPLKVYGKGDIFTIDKELVCIGYLTTGNTVLKFFIPLLCIPNSKISVLLKCTIRQRGNYIYGNATTPAVVTNSNMYGYQINENGISILLKNANKFPSSINNDAIVVALSGAIEFQ